MKNLIALVLCFLLFIGCSKDSGTDDVLPDVVLPVENNLHCWSSISGSSHSVAIQSDGSLWAWGVNNDGELGDGTYEQRNSPVQIQVGTTWKKVSVGRDHTLAIKSDGTLWAWGSNNDRQLNTDLVVRNLNTPLQIGTANDWEFVSTGSFKCFAIKKDGSLWAWGSNVGGSLGVGVDDPIVTNVTQVGTSKWKYISGGERHTLGIQTDGSLWAWGGNNRGELGNGGTELYTNLPVKIGNASNWISVSASFDFSLALKSDGTIWGWGKNDGGQLGIGNKEDVNKPIQIGKDANWKSLAAGFVSAVGVKNDGTLWVWGGGINSIPTRKGTDVNWDFATSGWYYVAAIKKDSGLWTWGYNFLGQLGDGTIIDKDSPTYISCKSS
ncbi:RCC1 domain-containing protein [Flavobacterium taihuense]|jgi:alpha-tubulin suppressor-like RCC1 family protein|uniref:Uncharacterized protein n=1 Tax=Flavobacterium taihuense TaxID=2857508 RepID=A0ABS6XZ40_9FLAO|nr:hypothetical protein [Flavobacterium taihuense]MBW4361941.1 hypothetical protein [Flavobacterium taihuense]